MTRKDFELLAGVLNRLNADFNNCGDDSVSLALVAEELALPYRSYHCDTVMPKSDMPCATLAAVQSLFPPYPEALRLAAFSANTSASDLPLDVDV